MRKSSKVYVICTGWNAKNYNALFYKQESTYHGLWYSSRAAQIGTGKSIIIVRSTENVWSYERRTSGELNITSIDQKGYIMFVYTSTHLGLLQIGLIITKWVFFITKWAPSFITKWVFFIIKWGYLLQNGRTRSRQTSPSKCCLA